MISSVAPVQSPEPIVHERLLAAIRELELNLRSRAAEIEVARVIPPDVFDALRAIGLFRMLTPQSHGGLELDFPAVLDVFQALAKIDASIGWIVALGVGSALFPPLLPSHVFEQVYEEGPDLFIAGSLQPVGTAEAVAGGWRVNGRWPFASGCQYAGWLYGACIMTKHGKPIPGPAGEKGPPLTRAFLLPAEHWEIEDTWYSAGLKGTGSHHISLTDTLVPDPHFFDVMNGQPCLPGPLYQAVRQLLPLIHGAISVGIAEGALNDIVELANTGRKQIGAAVPMRESEIFQSELGRVAADVRAAQAFQRVQTESQWRRAIAGTLKDEALFTQAAQASVWVTATCTRSIDACFTLGGSVVVYEASPLQRRLRDIHVAAQHTLGQKKHFLTAGKLLLAS
jgi:indole-3-acetate monooxygenase